MRVEPGASEQWWSHLRHRPADGRVDRPAAAGPAIGAPAAVDAAPGGLWPTMSTPSAGQRPPTALDALAPEPPVLGELACRAEDLNLRAEAFGVTERSLGWLRTWGRHFPELADHLLDVALAHLQHPRQARFSSLGAAQEVVVALVPVLRGSAELLLEGRIDDAWLERTRSMAALLDSMGLGLDVITCAQPARAHALRRFALDEGASADEVATLLLSAAAYDRFANAVCADAFADAHRNRPAASRPPILLPSNASQLSHS